MRGARLAAALLLVAIAGEPPTVAAAAERFADPIRAFVEGYDPSGNDFLANVPERTVLLRIRADVDGDGQQDLALSDSSTWGNIYMPWTYTRWMRAYSGGSRYKNARSSSSPLTRPMPSRLAIGA